MGVIQTWVTKNAEGTCFIMWILNFKTACLALFSKFRPHTKRSDLPPSILETMTVEWWLFGMEHLQNFANKCSLSHFAKNEFNSAPWSRVEETPSGH